MKRKNTGFLAQGLDFLSYNIYNHRCAEVAER